MEISWYSLALGEVFSRLGSKIEGLTSREAEHRISSFGENRIFIERRASFWRVAARQLKSPLVFLLVLAGIITVIFGSLTDAIVIGGAVILNTVIGFFYEYRATRAIEALRHRQEFFSWVKRDGNWRELEIKKIVPGDIVRLKPGSLVPADGRLLSAYNLTVNEAVLTGESEEILKKTGVLAVDTGLSERNNMVWAGTAVLDGSGEILITATGLGSEFGKIQKTLDVTPEQPTPFEKKIARLGRFLALVIGLTVLVIFGIGVEKGNGLLPTLQLAVAVAVSAIPEGLPIAVTVILAIGLTRILARRGLVKRLAATEALGVTSVILTDKTGTLTKAEMSVERVVGALGKHNQTEFVEVKASSSAYRTIIEAAVLASEAIVENPEEPPSEWRIRGRASEQAIVKAAAGLGISPAELKEEYSLLSEIPFTSGRKFAAYFRRRDNKIFGFFLGAPEVLLPYLRRLDTPSGSISVTHRDLIELLPAVSSLANAGFRVLLAGYNIIKPGENHSLVLKDNLIFVGLLGLADPVRQDVPDMIESARQAGIRTVMVTGDHSLTARQVAKKIKLLGSRRTLATVMEGRELEKIETNELVHRVRSIDIFARISPAEKVKIVEAWQRAGETVAMSGDGVNDAPALARADVGIAVGTGTDIAKDTADIVLLDNSFSTIVVAVREGRVVLENLKKVVAYLLSNSFAEIILVAASLLGGLPLAVIPAQILWVNLVEDGLPSIALAFEPAGRDIMTRPPLLPRRPLIDKEMRFLIATIGGFTTLITFGLFLFFLFTTADLALTRTVVFGALALSSLFYVFSLRSFRLPLWQIHFWANRHLIGAVIIGGALIVAAVYLAPLQILLKTKPLGPLEWIILGGFGILNIVAIETAKWLFYRRKK